LDLLLHLFEVSSALVLDFFDFSVYEDI